MRSVRYPIDSGIVPVTGTYTPKLVTAEFMVVDAHPTFNSPTSQAPVPSHMLSEGVIGCPLLHAKPDAAVATIKSHINVSENY